MSIIKESEVLRSAILERLKDLYPSDKFEFNQAAVIKDADERGFKIASSALSRYAKGDKKNSSLSEIQIVWLSLRYGITLDLKIDMPKYDESKALQNLKNIFG